MKPIIMLAWRLLDYSGLIFLAILVGSVYFDDNPARRIVAWTLAIALTVAHRGITFAKLHILQVLPDGPRTLMRSLAFIAGACLLVTAAALAGADADKILVPLTAAFMMYTLMGLCVFTCRQKPIVRLTLLPLFLLTLSLFALAMSRAAPAAAEEFAAGAALAAAVTWTLLLAARRLPRPWTHRLAHTERTSPPDSSAWHAGQSRATFALLQSGRRLINQLPMTVLCAVIAALFYHQTLGSRQPVDNYAVVVVFVASLAAILAFAYSFTLPGSARHLWLRSGASRGQLFGIAELSIVRYGIVVMIGWGVATGLALLRDLPVDARQAVLTYTAMNAAVAAPLYLGLMFQALRKWQQVLAFIALLFACIVVPSLLMRAFGMTNQGIGPGDPARIAALFAGIVLLRFVARWSWLRIDWARVRPMQGGRV